MSFHSIGANLPLLSVEIDKTSDPTTGVRTWTDVTTLVRSLNFRRSGRDDELQQTTPGTLTVVFNDRADAFTTLGMRKSQWIRVQAQWAGVTYARWQGIATSLVRAWPQAGLDALVTLQAADVLKVFNLYDLVGTTFAAQRNDQRFSAIAALVGITTGSVDTDTDAADAIVDPIAEGTDALSTLLEIEQSENGLLVGEPDGSISFQGRHWRILHSSSSLATFGESAGQIPYRDSVEYQDDDARLANEVSVTPAGGAAQTVSDATSQAKHFHRRLNRTLLTSNASIALDAANFLLNRYKDPSPRIPALTVQLARVARVSSGLVATLLGADNSDRFTWRRAASTTVSKDVFVEQIGETIIPGTDWQLQFQLSPADDESGWVLGDSVLGVLGSTTRLTY